MLEPEMNVQPMTVKLKPGVRSTRDSSSTTSVPDEKSRMVRRTGGTIGGNGDGLPQQHVGVRKCRNDHPKMWRQLEGYGGLVRDEQTVLPIPNLESVARVFTNAIAFLTLNLLERHLQIILLGPEARRVFTMITLWRFV